MSPPQKLEALSLRYDVSVPRLRRAIRLRELPADCGGKGWRTTPEAVEAWLAKEMAKGPRRGGAVGEYRNIKLG